jgi:hypothetical protein
MCEVFKKRPLFDVPMPTCRHCRCAYPSAQFIDGIGPRHLVCVRCGVEKGYLTADEAPALYDEQTAKARMALYARRYGMLFWLISCWGLWVLYFQELELWSKLTLVLLILATLVTPVLFFLRTTKFNAQLRQLTP